MSTFTLAISCLTTSNFPWFMDLTFQVPMQYCSLQHRTLLLSPVGYCFYFGSIHSFFLELFLHWSPVAYWAPTNPGSSSFSILSFCIIILFMGFSRQEYWSGLPFPLWPTHLGLPRGHGLVSLSLTRLWLVFCEYGFSVSALWCPLATPTILLRFSYLGRGISSRLLQQSAAAAPYLGWGVSPHSHPSWLPPS